MSALRNHAALAGHDGEDADNGTMGFVASRQAKRCDTLIATALLAVLIAGWVMNFVSIRQLVGVGTFLAHGITRQA